jgi:hypothetical protein
VPEPLVVGPQVGNNVGQRLQFLPAQMALFVPVAEGHRQRDAEEDQQDFAQGVFR